MKKNIILLFLFGFEIVFPKWSFSQKIQLIETSNQIEEPIKNNNGSFNTQKVSKTFNLACPSCAEEKYVIKIKKHTSSDYPNEISIPDITNFPDTKSISFDIETSLSDKDEKLVLELELYDINDKEKLLDTTLLTFVIINKYPSLAAPGPSVRPWGEARTAEVFIGTNFDFFDDNFKASDWYGGLRAFLPNLQRIGKKEKEKNGKLIVTPERLGLTLGFYQSKSFSQETFPQLKNKTEEGTYFADRVVGSRDTVINNIKNRVYAIERDNIKVTPKAEIRNFGLYGGLIFQVNNINECVRDGILNLYVGVQAEVIRRSLNYEVLIDTLSRAEKSLESAPVPPLRTGLYPPARVEFPYPQSIAKSIYTDAYYGVIFPMQYLWKDIMDVRLTPGFGYSVNGYKINGLTSGPQKFYYVVQFDLLARLGGLSLNLGGEVRGYFPKDAPIIGVYLGSSFSITKLIDFVVKK